MNKPLHLPPAYLAAVKTILQQHVPHADVWAYGSRVNGDYFDASDLDLVVRPSAAATLAPAWLESLREVFVESDLPIIVQLVDWNGIPQAFRDEILAGYSVVQGGQGYGG
jgi:predicted nucleotidyltransferase